MICQICGKDFNYLGAHLKKHKITSREYKFTFDIPLGTPLEEEFATVLRRDIAIKTMDKEAFAGYAIKGRRAYEKTWHEKKDVPRCTVQKNRNPSKETLQKIRITCRDTFLKKNKEAIKELISGKPDVNAHKEHLFWTNTRKKYFKDPTTGLTGKRNVYTAETKKICLEEIAKGASYIETATKHKIRPGTLSTWVGIAKRTMVNI